MLRYLPLLALVASCSQGKDTGAMSDAAFAEATLSRAQIEHSLAAAENSLKSLGLDCAELVTKPLPGIAPNPEVRTIVCSRLAPPRDQCRQQIQLTARRDKISTISLDFEQLHGSVDGSLCGR
jgi:hypothetical protein